MKRTLVLVFVVLGIGATLSQAQTTKKRTVWVEPATGSHLGGGFVDAGDTDNSSPSKLPTAQENTTLGIAVASLDAKADTIVDGYSLLPTAVSWQTKVPVEDLKRQRAKSGLTYGQLLVANSLASASGKSFDQVLALRAKSRNWSLLADSLHVSVKSIILRINAADNSLKYAESRRRARREQNLNDSGDSRGNRVGLVPGG